MTTEEHLEKPNPQTGVDLNTGFVPLMIFLYFCSPVIKIDSVAIKLKWRRSFDPATPGHHAVEIYYNYFFMPTSRAETFVEIPEGGTVAIEYSAPMFVFLPGKLWRNGSRQY